MIVYTSRVVKLEQHESDEANSALVALMLSMSCCSGDKPVRRLVQPLVEWKVFLDATRKMDVKSGGVLHSDLQHPQCQCALLLLMLSLTMLSPTI